MDIKTGSKEELEAEERLERLRIASGERKWKMELQHKFVAERRQSYLDYFNKNDGSTFGVWLIGAALTVVIVVCLIKITWSLF